MLFVAVVLLFMPDAARPQDPTSHEKLLKELLDEEVVLERIKSVVPPGFDLAAERKAIADLARKAKLSKVDVKVVPGTEQVSLDDGQPAPMVIDRLEISGRDGYDAVHFFLSMLRRRSRIVGVESVSFDAAQGGTVRFAARLMYPSWTQIPPQKDLPSDEGLRRRLSRNRAISARIVDTLTRLRAGGTVDALAVFTKAADKYAIALTSVRIHDGISMKGFVLGSAARAALPASLERAQLPASKVEWSRAGVCQAFSFNASVEPAEEPEATFTAGSPIFDADSATFCKRDAASPKRRILVRGAASKDDNAFFLRLHDVDLVDAFFVINDLIAESFVIDQDVKERIDFDILEGATVEETLNALSASGIVIGSKPLRRVSRGEPAVLSVVRPTSGGAPINLSIRDAPAASILCALREVSGRQIRVPRDLRRRVSVFATDLPAGDAVDELLPSSAAADVNPCELSDDNHSRLSAFRLSLEQLAIADLRIAGRAHVEDAWYLYAYTPSRGVVRLVPGQRLFDGSVKSVGADGVTFSSDAKGTLEVPFVP